MPRIPLSLIGFLSWSVWFIRHFPSRNLARMGVHANTFDGLTNTGSV